MKKALGVLVYPDRSDISQDKVYLKKASECGSTRIFMSVLEVADGEEAVQKKFKELISYAKNLGFETTLDIVPSIFDELEISYDDLTFFSELGADGIRLDIEFNGNKEATLTFNPFDVAAELNMSNDVVYLGNILTYEANRPLLYGCHNFYSRAVIVLPHDFFEKCSIRFKKEGIRTAAFISSQVDEIGPWDVNDGLPILGMHRQLPVTVQAKRLFATSLIDGVVVENVYASNEELEALGQLSHHQTELAIVFEEATSEIEKEIAIENQHFRRGDITQRTIRSTEVHKEYKNEAGPPHDNQAVLQPRGVVVGNDVFGKYKSELQTVLEPHQNSRKNRIGHIIEEELVLLELTRPQTKFRFMEK